LLDNKKAKTFTTLAFARQKSVAHLIGAENRAAPQELLKTKMRLAGDS
jgi:hypothetical protein